MSSTTDGLGRVRIAVDSTSNCLTSRSRLPEVEIARLQGLEFDRAEFPDRIENCKSADPGPRNTARGAKRTNGPFRRPTLLWRTIWMAPERSCKVVIEFPQYSGIVLATTWCGERAFEGAWRSQLSRLGGAEEILAQVEAVEWCCAARPERGFATV